MISAKKVRHVVALSASLASVFLLAAALVAFRADAAEPVTYELPDATHASSLSVAPDGTLWFVPVRGTEWEGKSESIIASISPDGGYTEHQLRGFDAIDKLSVGLDGEIWVAGYIGRYTTSRTLEIGRLSAAGSPEAVYQVGRGGWIKSLHAAGDAAWFIHETFAGNGPSTLERISGDGTHRQVSARQDCDARADAVSRGGAVGFTEVCATTSRSGGPRRAFVGHVEGDGKIVRRALPTEERPSSITFASDGSVWFGLLHRYPNAGYGYWKIGHLTASDGFSQYGFHRPSVTSSIAAGTEKRIWFTSTLGRGYVNALDWIGPDGKTGTPVCAEPSCGLVPSDLTAAPDGSIWYALTAPNLNTGGGGSGLAIGEEIANGPGSVARLDPAAP